MPADFSGNESIKYVNNMIFGNNINNPNEGKIFEDDFQLGSVGFVGQNFNTGATDYSSQNLVITAPSFGTITKPEVSETNSVTVEVDRSSANFASGVKVYLYVSKLPVEAEYTDAANTYEENFIFDSLDVLEGAALSSSTIINDLDVDINGGDPKKLDISFDLTWSTAQQAMFDDGDNLFIGLIVEDGTLDAELVRS